MADNEKSNSTTSGDTDEVSGSKKASVEELEKKEEEHPSNESVEVEDEDNIEDTEDDEDGKGDDTSLDEDDEDDEEEDDEDEDDEESECDILRRQLQNLILSSRNMRNEAAAEKEELENEITALKKSLAEKSKEFNSKVENFKNTLTCLHEETNKLHLMLEAEEKAHRDDIAKFNFKSGQTEEKYNGKHTVRLSINFTMGKIDEIALVPDESDDGTLRSENEMLKQMISEVKEENSRLRLDLDRKKDELQMLKDDNGVNVPAMLEDRIGSIREKYLEMNSVYQIPFNPRYSSMIFTEQGKESIPFDRIFDELAEAVVTALFVCYSYWIQCVRDYPTFDELLAKEGNLQKLGEFLKIKIKDEKGIKEDVKVLNSDKITRASVPILFYGPEFLSLYVDLLNYAKFWGKMKKCSSDANKLLSILSDKTEASKMPSDSIIIGVKGSQEEITRLKEPVAKCVEYVVNHANLQGLFVEKGKPANIAKIVDALKSAKVINFSSFSPHEIASGLLKYLDDYAPFLEMDMCQKQGESKEDYVSRLKSIPKNLDDERTLLITTVMHVFNEILKLKDVNRSSSNTLGVKLAPYFFGIINFTSFDVMKVAQDSTTQILNNIESIFPKPFGFKGYDPNDRPKPRKGLNVLDINAFLVKSPSPSAAGIPPLHSSVSTMLVPFTRTEIPASMSMTFSRSPDRMSSGAASNSSAGEAKSTTVRRKTISKTRAKRNILPLVQETDSSDVLPSEGYLATANKKQKELDASASIAVDEKGASSKTVSISRGEQALYAEKVPNVIETNDFVIISILDLGRRVWALGVNNISKKSSILLYSKREMCIRDTIDLDFIPKGMTIVETPGKTKVKTVWVYGENNKISIYGEDKRLVDQIATESDCLITRIYTHDEYVYACVHDLSQILVWHLGDGGKPVHVKTLDCRHTPQTMLQVKSALWVGMESGIVKFTGKKFKAEKCFDEENYILELYYSGRYVYAITKNKMLVYEPDTSRIVKCITVDDPVMTLLAGNNIWVAQANQCINILNLSEFNVCKELWDVHAGKVSAMALVETKKDIQVWVAGSGKTLSVINTSYIHHIMVPCTFQNANKCCAVCSKAMKKTGFICMCCTNFCLHKECNGDTSELPLCVAPESFASPTLPKKAPIGFSSNLRQSASGSSTMSASIETSSLKTAHL